MTGFENFRALVELEDNLENLDRELNILATKIVDEMRADAPKDTGALKRSIKLNLDRYGFQIEMLNYGFFNNYGVGPTARTPFNRRPTGGTPQQPFGVTEPLTLGNYEYQNRKFGLPARPFFDLEEIQNRLIDVVLNTLEE